MKVVLVTRDVGNGNGLKLVAQGLGSHGHEIAAFFGEGKPMPEGSLGKIREALQGADWLLVSLSSTEERVAEEHFAMEKAILLGVRIAIFGDIYGSIHRSRWCGDCARHANLLTVVAEEEVAAARKYVGAHTQIVCTGNPYWAEFFKSAVCREEVRSKLGVGPGDKLIVAIGSKEPDRNRALYTDAVKAAGELGRGVQLILTLHPGADHGKDVYSDILAQSPVPVQLFGKGDISSSVLIGGSDVVVTGGGSLVGVEAICRRIPTIDLIHDPLDKEWWRGLSGLDFWPPNRLGVSLLTRSVSDLAVAMKSLLDKRSEAAQKMLAAQEANFSLQMFQGATEKILRALTG